MALKVVTGVPGSGKSYFVIREVILKNYQWNSEFHEWEPKEKGRQVTIVTNIAGLRVPHVQLYSFLKEEGITINEFLTYKWFKENTERLKWKNVVIILDEAQKHFPREFKDRKDVQGGQNPEESVFYFFEYHRHLGVDIYLLAQLWTRLSPNIVELAEYQIEAVRRTLSIIGEFRYRFLNGREKIGGTTIKGDKKIFALYSSFEVEEENRGKKVSPYKTYGMLVAGLGLAFAGLLYYFFTEKLLLPNRSPDPPAAVDRGLPTGASGSEKEGPGLHTRDVPRTARGDGPSPVPPADLGDIEVVQAGALWFRDRPAWVKIGRQVLRIEDVPYSVFVDPGARRVLVSVPREDMERFLPREPVQIENMDSREYERYRDGPGGSEK